MNKENCYSKFVVTILIVISAVHPTHAQLSLSADLAFIFSCANVNTNKVEQKVEEFLKENKFRVLNRGRIQREHGIFLLKTDIAGLDSMQRIISVVALPTAADTYSVGLNTVPPTQRSAELENTLLKFVTSALNCEVRQVERHENSSDKRFVHDRNVARIEKQFLQIEQLLKRPRL